MHLKKFAIAISELLYPAAPTPKSTVPTGGGELAQIQKGPTNSGIAVNSDTASSW
jgi:hypothetical protein